MRELTVTEMLVVSGGKPTRPIGWLEVAALGGIGGWVAGAALGGVVLSCMQSTIYKVMDGIIWGGISGIIIGEGGVLLVYLTHPEVLKP
jgi:hypothetical protein